MSPKSTGILFAVLAATPAHAAIFSITMAGHVTHMPPIGQDLPAPWHTAAVGDSWSLTLTYEGATPPIPAGGQTQFRGFARSYQFTLDGMTTSAALPASPTLSQAFMQNGAADYFGFDLAIFDGPLRFGAGLTDLHGSVFATDQVLPTGFATDDFEVRDAGVWRAIGGSPAAAMRFSVESVTPAPSACVLLALAAGVWRARRR